MSNKFGLRYITSVIEQGVIADVMQQRCGVEKLGVNLELPLLNYSSNYFCNNLAVPIYNGERLMVRCVFFMEVEDGLVGGGGHGSIVQGIAVI